MEEKKDKERISDALMKVALGCSVEEVTVEYAEVDGKLKVTRKKKTKKDIPPDLKAVQLLLGKSEPNDDCSLWSDEELNAEKERLLGLLKEKETKNKSAEKEGMTAASEETVGDGREKAEKEEKKKNAATKTTKSSATNKKARSGRTTVRKIVKKNTAGKGQVSDEEK